VIDAAKGESLSQVGGVNGKFGVARGADGIVLTDGRKRITVLSQTDGSIIKQVITPADYTTVAASLPQGVIGASEADISVRLLNPQAQKPEEATVWQNIARGHVPKHVAPGGHAIAVGYWGGLVRALSADGKTAAASLFDQDINCVEWVGQRLLVALADGRLLALEL
jgi:hypothetical protein